MDFNMFFFLSRRDFSASLDRFVEWSWSDVSFRLPFSHTFVEIVEIKGGNWPQLCFLLRRHSIVLHVADANFHSSELLVIHRANEEFICSLPKMLFKQRKRGKFDDDALLQCVLTYEGAC
jgi:hypothetical protein